MASGLGRQPSRPRISAPHFSTLVDDEEEQNNNVTGISIKTDDFDHVSNLTSFSLRQVCQQVIPFEIIDLTMNN